MGGRGRWGRRKTRRLEFNDTQLIVTTVETVITHKPYERPLPPPDDLTLTYKGYELIASCWDGEKTPFYPMLPTDRAWSLVARQGDSIDDPQHAVHAQHRFGMSQPTLSWVNGAEVIEAYIDGLTTEQFCQTYGIDLAVTKSGFVTFKRLSRLFRDYRLSARLPDSDVRLEYLDLDSTGEIQWDGAGLISRAMLERLQISPHLPLDQQARLREELKHIGRVEFTVNNSAGQHKGHAIVVDDLEVDFRVPRDIKKDVKLTDGTTFIGINAVHSDDRMRLDIQSIANLHPFFSTETMATYLKQHETLSDQAVISGAKGEGMARLNGATRRELDDQPKREYLASGGPATALPSLIDQCYSGAIENIEQNLEKGKLRIPVPGGRYYVMSGAVAQTAGLNLSLERGQVHLDPRTSTAWVHPDDWLSMQDSPNGQGIRDILGGADQDDALWVHGFTDHDGQRKVLAWRSPNNTGEYIILNPHAESSPLPWHTPEGETLIDPPGDSRQLPPRIDLTRHEGRTTYKHLVQDTQVGDLGQGQPYSVGLTGEVLQRTMTNKGVLGAYCNYVMAYKTATGQVPSELPCTMEEVVDADVKTGADLSQVKAWLEAANRRLISGGTPISTLIAPRVGLSLDDSGQVPRGKQFGRQWVEVKSTEGQHWSDALKQVVETHKKHLIEQRNTLMKAARLPNAVYDSVATDAVAQDAGARFNQTYARALKAAQETYGRLVTANPRTERSLHEKQQRRQQQLIRDYVRDECEDVLRSYPDDQHTAILRGAMVSREMGEKKPADKAGRTRKKTSVYDELAITSDAALWQRGYIGQTTLKALREVEVIGEIVEETNAHGQRLVHYPPPTQVARQASYDQTPINMVWYNHLLEDLRRRGEPLPSSPSNVADATQIQYKANVRHRSRRSHEQGGYIGMPLVVDERYLNDNDTQKRLVFVDEQGRVFGMVNKKAHDRWQPGDEAVIRQAKPDHDGHLDVTIEHRI